MADATPTLRKACKSCSALRKRCSGTQPCDACTRTHRECVYELSKRKIRGSDRKTSSETSTETVGLSPGNSPPQFTLSAQDLELLMKYLQPGHFADELSYALQTTASEAEMMQQQREIYIKEWVPPALFSQTLHVPTTAMAITPLCNMLMQCTLEDKNLSEVFVKEVIQYQPSEVIPILFGGTSPDGPYSAFKTLVTGAPMDRILFGELPVQRLIGFLNPAKILINKRLVLFDSYFASLTIMKQKPDVKIPVDAVRSTLILLALTQSCMTLCPDHPEVQSLFPNAVQLSSFLGFPDLSPHGPRVLPVDWTEEDVALARNITSSLTLTSLQIAILAHKRPIWPVPRQLVVGDLMNTVYTKQTYSDLGKHNMESLFGAFLGEDLKSFLQLWFLFGQIIDFKLALEHEVYSSNSFPPNYQVSNEKIADVFRFQLHQMFLHFRPTIRAVEELTNAIIGKDLDTCLDLLQQAPIDRSRLNMPDLPLLLTWHSPFLFLEYMIKIVDRPAGKTSSDGTYESFKNMNKQDSEPFMTDIDSFTVHHQGAVSAFKLGWLRLRDRVEPSTSTLRFLLSREYWRFCLFQAGCTASNLLLYIMKPLGVRIRVEYAQEDVEMDGIYPKSSGRSPLVRVDAKTDPKSVGLDSIMAIQGIVDNLNTVLAVMELGTTWKVSKMRSAKELLVSTLTSTRFRPTAELGPTWSSLPIE